MIRSDRWTALFLFLFSLYVCVESVRLGFGTYFQPGPGFFPFYAGLLVALLSLVLMFASFRAPKKEESWENARNIFMVSLSMFVFALLLEQLGFIVVAFLFAAFLFRVIERRGWIFSLLTAFLIAGASYVIFDRWLQAQLPAGILGQ